MILVTVCLCSANIWCPSWSSSDPDAALRDLKKEVTPTMHESLTSKTRIPRRERILSQYCNTKILPKVTACHRKSPTRTIWVNSLKQSVWPLLSPPSSIYIPKVLLLYKALNNSWWKSSWDPNLTPPHQHLPTSGYTEFTKGLRRKEEGNPTIFDFDIIHEAWTKVQRLSYHNFSE